MDWIFYLLFLTSEGFGLKKKRIGKNWQMTMIRIINTAGLAEFDLSLEKIHIKCKQEHFFLVVCSSCGL